MDHYTWYRTRQILYNTISNNNNIIYDYGEFDGMKIGRGNRSTRRKPALFNINVIWLLNVMFMNRGFKLLKWRTLLYILYIYYNYVNYARGCSNITTAQKSISVVSFFSGLQMSYSFWMTLKLEFIIYSDILQRKVQRKVMILIQKWISEPSFDSICPQNEVNSELNTTDNTDWSAGTELRLWELKLSPMEWIWFDFWTQ
jgi:hypothetical protein